MGQRTPLLLVVTLAALLSLLSPAKAQEQAFWLWSGVRPGDALREADVVYLHQGDVVINGGNAVFERKGLPVNRLVFPRIWLTVRFATLDVPERLLLRLNSLLARWQAAGNEVVGLQIDFDAATWRLDEYARFLQRLRQTLPANYALGVTGLLDWAKTGRVDTLNALPVDELVVQSYQGRRTVANFAAYLPALSGLRIPFKLGVVPGGICDTQAIAKLAASRWYRGTVTFLLNPSRGDDSSRKGCP
ncbi:DUF3142 domain-containing protein [Kosakonia cowanii]|uniref:DUF3142 domain-containing protein n=1 Tax=Kosakonia cowanii TaxID=208223 RepID=UPI0023F7B6BB|nr:DUF3142 domain-containing protein [Kosakonia cowanii]MDF7758724.1 DUF3142 domain-containing protein [Kosakonia cowanii]